MSLLYLTWMSVMASVLIVFSCWLFCRRDVEPPEAPLPAAKRPRAAGKELGRKGRPHHREAELPALWHDHAPSDQQQHQAAPHQEGPGGRAGKVGERPPSNGQATACAHLFSPFLGRPGKCLRAAARRPVRPGHEESEAAAGTGARGGEHEGQRQRAAVGRGGRLHQMRPWQRGTTKKKTVVAFTWHCVGLGIRALTPTWQLY